MIGSILVLRSDLTILGLRSTEDQVGQYFHGDLHRGVVVPGRGGVRAAGGVGPRCPARRVVSRCGHGGGAGGRAGRRGGGAARRRELGSPQPLSAAGLLAAFGPPWCCRWPRWRARPRVMAGALGMVKTNRRLYRYAVGSVVLCLLHRRRRPSGRSASRSRRWSSTWRRSRSSGVGALARAAVGSRS